MTNDANETGDPAPATPRPAPKLSKVPGGLPDLDKQLRDLSAPDDGTVKIRLSAMVYHPIEQRYVNYDTVSWIGEFPSVEMASGFREDLDGFVRGWFAARA